MAFAQPPKVHSTTDKFLGSVSCASASCHGDPHRATVVGSAAHHFWERDKHQFAGTLLREQRSQEIAERLKLSQPAWQTRQCLNCHAPGAVHSPDRETFSTMLTEGVGCESCHGSARQWIAPHRSAEWKRSDLWSSPRKSDAGFVELKQLVTRADRCADCHVGNADQSVNHDLIAAGHPRLAFEFAAYQSQMPIHWRHAEERRRSPAANVSHSPNQSTYEARNWLIGQLVSADHELEILTAAARSPQRTWPELAQYDCFGCHHQLASPGWRQARTAWNLRPGEFQWGSWSLGLIAETQPALRGIVSDRFAADQQSLRTLMKTMSPERSEALSLVAALRRELAVATDRSAMATFTSEELIAIKRTLLDGHESMTSQGWDRSAQLFLAIVALEKGANDSLGMGDRVSSSRTDTFVRLRELLSYREQSGTTSKSIDIQESPNRFEVNWAALREAFQRLQSADESFNGTGTDIPPAPTKPAAEIDG